MFSVLLLDIWVLVWFNFGSSFFTLYLCWSTLGHWFIFETGLDFRSFVFLSWSSICVGDLKSIGDWFHHCLLDCGYSRANPGLAMLPFASVQRKCAALNFALSSQRTVKEWLNLEPPYTSLRLVVTASTVDHEVMWHAVLFYL